ALFAPADEAPRRRLLAHLAQGRRLRLTAAFGNRFGEVREDDGEPQPRADAEAEPRRRSVGAGCEEVAHPDERGHDAADLDHEHHGVPGYVLRQELAEARNYRRSDDLRIEQ